MIRAIIFDSHDTVIKNGWNFVLPKGRDLKPETWQPFWRGKITEEEFWRRAAGEFGKDKNWIKRGMATYYSLSVPIKGILPLLQRLKKKYQLGFLGNVPLPWFEDAVSRFKLDEIFDVLVSSGETGFLKPEKEIYLLTCRELGVLPKECFYIDDNQVNLQAALKFEMKGILFKNPKQLIRELKHRELL